MVKKALLEAAKHHEAQQNTLKAVTTEDKAVKESIAVSRQARKALASNSK